MKCRDVGWVERSGDIEAVQDSATHVTIMPTATMLLEKYETALAKTRNDWVLV